MVLRFAWALLQLVGSQSPYDLAAQQLLEEECPLTSRDSHTRAAWLPTTIASLEAREHLASNFGAQHRAAALAHLLASLLQLFDEQLALAFRCPALASQHLQVAAEWSLFLDQPNRARVLIQLGHAFKFQALKEFASLYHEFKEAQGTNPTEEMLETMPNAPPKKFLPRLHVEYQVLLGQLHGALHVKPAEWQRAGRRLGVEIHSICSYKPDPTSKTSLESPLLQLSVPNHRAYAAQHGYRYVVHTESALPDREAHYSKMFVVHQRLSGVTPTWAHTATASESAQLDWVFFIDCDAFFTDFATSIEDLLETYASPEKGDVEGPHFLVAEDPGGINTGVFAVRRSIWSIRFLERVASSTFNVAWDQSMFFWDMVRGAMDMDLAAFSADFRYSPQVRLIHQAHLNAFVPPASVDWMAHEWRPGDFVRHFAGCPWQEPVCLAMMSSTAAFGSLSRERQHELASNGMPER